MSALVAVVAGAARELAEALVRKHAGAAATTEQAVRAMIAEELRPIIDKLSTLEADVQRRLAELGMLLATSSLATGAEGVAMAFETNTRTIPNFLDGVSIEQMPPDWKPETDAQPIEEDDVLTPTPEGSSAK